MASSLATSQSNYLVLPDTSHGDGNRRQPSSPGHSSLQQTSSTPVASVPVQGASLPNFKAPAHKHAHHLHSIPPREKSTRTLILDYMLWLHARTRLQQARAELGMITNIQSGADGTVAEGTTEEQDVLSDGEDIVMLKFGVKERQRDMRLSSEDEHLITQNLPLSRTLRLRADGVEKVLTAMLDQPPEVQSLYSDEDTPRTPPAIHGIGEHHFPNGVRLRLALSTLINDLFARDVPTPLSPPSSNTPSSKPRPISTPTTSPAAVSYIKPAQPSTFFLSPSEIESDSDTLPNGLPCALAPLATISNYAIGSGMSKGISKASDGNGGGTMLPSFQTVTHASSNPTTDILPPILSVSPPTEGLGPQTSPKAQPSPRTTRNFPSLPTQVPKPHIIRPSLANSRVLALYKAGADPSTANSPPSLRCPRHLHHSCVICAAVKTPPLPAVSSSPLAPSSARSSPVMTRSAIMLGNNGSKSKTPGIGALGHGLSSWKTGAGVGAGLAKPGIRGTALLRRTISHHTTSHPTAKDAGPCASGGKLADLIPRFIRLSALVAIELGREAREGEEEAAGPLSPRGSFYVGGSNEAVAAPTNSMDSGRDDGHSSVRDGLMMSDIQLEDEPSSQGPTADASPPQTRTSMEVAHDNASDVPDEVPSPTSPTSLPSPSPLFAAACRPTREWYAILSGLLTRAVLEGYLSRGWKGPQGMQCLLGVGLGLAHKPDAQPAPLGMQAPEGDLETGEDEEYAHIDPDDFPSLLDAAKILLPSLRGRTGVQDRDNNFQLGPDADYETEMMTRVREFLTVPSSTPDLSTHLEDLGYKFPAEPVERAAIRFCEAVARWRGKPELESYRKINIARDAQVNDGHSRRAPIDKYFTLQLARDGHEGVGRGKRRRSFASAVDDGREGGWGGAEAGAKRMNVEGRGGGEYVPSASDGSTHQSVFFSGGL